MNTQQMYQTLSRRLNIPLQPLGRDRIQEILKNSHRRQWEQNLAQDISLAQKHEDPAICAAWNDFQLVYRLVYGQKPDDMPRPFFRQDLIKNPSVMAAWQEYAAVANHRLNPDAVDDLIWRHP